MVVEGEIPGRPLKRGTGGGGLPGQWQAQRSLHLVGPGYGPELGRLPDAEVGGSPGAAAVFPVKQ